MATLSLRTQSIKTHQRGPTISLFLDSGTAVFLSQRRSKTPITHLPFPPCPTILMQVVKSPSLPWIHHRRRQHSPYDSFCQVIPSYTSHPINFVRRFSYASILSCSCVRERKCLDGKVRPTISLSRRACQDSSPQVLSSCWPSHLKSSTAVRLSFRLGNPLLVYCPPCIMSAAPIDRGPPRSLA